MIADGDMTRPTPPESGGVLLGPTANDTAVVTPTPLRTISYGGGVQSTALVVLAGQGVIDFPLALFANVGETSEHPDTLTYVRDVAIPWGREHGVEIVELHKMRKGQIDDLRETILRKETLSVPIPIRGGWSGAPGARSCTKNWKIQVVGKELKRRGASSMAPATIAVGISVDELERAKSPGGRTQSWETVTYPLLDLRLNRGDCEQIIRDAGLPVPPKSACYFCPFHRPQVWAEMRRDEPQLFEQAAEVEDAIIAQQERLGRDPLYLTRFGKPLREAVGEAQTPLFAEGPEGCDEGYCWT